MPWSFSIVLRKTMLHIWRNLVFVYWSVYDRKKKWRLKPWTCDQRPWFPLNSKTYERLFMRVPQIRNSQAWWIKYKRNDNSQQQPLIILGMAKWMVNGSESVKISKTLLTCCVLGKYDASYSCLFLGSYDTVEINFPIVKYLFRFLLLRNSNNETNSTHVLSKLFVHHWSKTWGSLYDQDYRYYKFLNIFHFYTLALHRYRRGHGFKYRI